MLIVVGSSGALYLLGAFALGAVGWRFALRRERQQALQWQQRIQAVRAEGQHLCFSTLESLAYAIEAGDIFNIGHLDCVQRCVLAIARALDLPEEETTALRAAALLHNIGRLGVPENILLKAGTLTPEEQEKLRTHPVLGARILASIPFPWPVIPIVRHHAEHWDGAGYPDGLKGTAIPLGARILAVANAYSALLRPRPYRSAYTSSDALAEIEARAGIQFDPSVVTAFRTLAVQLRQECDTDHQSAALAVPQRDARTALEDIAAAQRETQGLYKLAQALAGSLHLEALADMLLSCTREIVPCAACVLFLPEDDGEYLRAHAALGTNARHLLGSLARVGAYLTGRAFFRGEMMSGSFLADDLVLRDVSDPWIPIRSTLIVPLMTGGYRVGTINLYAEEPDAFGWDTQRVMRLIATQAGHAIDNARRFREVQESAYTDPLTGLRNARYLREFLEREINRASRDQTPIAVLNIDLDHFKPINDRYGHAVGDQTLREVAEILQGHVRNYDLAARYAGDEFVVVLARSGRLPSEVVAVKLKKAVERYVQRLAARDPDFPALGISVGIALYPEDGQDLQALLCRSDAAMYADKQARRATRDAA